MSDGRLRRRCYLCAGAWPGACLGPFADIQHNQRPPPPKSTLQIVLATNIAETSITIDDVTFVVRLSCQHTHVYRSGVCQHTYVYMYTDQASVFFLGGWCIHLLLLHLAHTSCVPSASASEPKHHHTTHHTHTTHTPTPGRLRPRQGESLRPLPQALHPPAQMGVSRLGPPAPRCVLAFFFVLLTPRACLSYLPTHIRAVGGGCLPRTTPHPRLSNHDPNIHHKSGRAGRTTAGVCFHLCSRRRYESLKEFRESELLTTPLEELCLQAKARGQKLSFFHVYGQCNGR